MLVFLGYWTSDWCWWHNIGQEGMNWGFPWDNRYIFLSNCHCCKRIGKTVSRPILLYLSRVVTFCIFLLLSYVLLISCKFLSIPSCKFYVNLLQFVLFVLLEFFSISLLCHLMSYYFAVCCTSVSYRQWICPIESMCKNMIFFSLYFTISISSPCVLSLWRYSWSFSFLVLAVLCWW